MRNTKKRLPRILIPLALCLLTAAFSSDIETGFAAERRQDAVRPCHQKIRVEPNAMYIDFVSELEDTIPVEFLWLGGRYQIRIHIQNNEPFVVVNLGFKIYSDDEVTWNWTAVPTGYPENGFKAITVIPGSRMYPPEQVFELTGLVVWERDIDGISPDTVFFGGSSLISGLRDGVLEPMAALHFGTQDMPHETGTLCIDSTFVPPYAPFGFSCPWGSWHLPDEFESPVCIPVRRILLGDFDLDEQITVGDPVEMIKYIFFGKPHLAPLHAGDANCDGALSVGDVVYMINYIFRFGPAPSCS